jgi:hypothetical protein
VGGGTFYGGWSFSKTSNILFGVMVCSSFRCFFYVFCVLILIYLSTAIGLTAGGSGTVHIYIQTIYIITQITTEQHKQQQNSTKNIRKTQITTNLEECGPCPIFASFTLAFALQPRKKHGKTSVR